MRVAKGSVEDGRPPGVSQISRNRSIFFLVNLDRSLYTLSMTKFIASLSERIIL
jgi:hypothetical protein